MTLTSRPETGPRSRNSRSVVCATLSPSPARAGSSSASGSGRRSWTSQRSSTARTTKMASPPQRLPLPPRPSPLRPGERARTCAARRLPVPPKLTTYALLPPTRPSLGAVASTPAWGRPLVGSGWVTLLSRDRPAILNCFLLY